jgi:hypothetical protein
VERRIEGEVAAGARVLLITSDRDECGIREYGRMLAEAMKLYQIQVTEFPHTHPDSAFAHLDCPRQYDVVHLNHHAALHSAWGPSRILNLQALGYPVIVTQHDTFETWAIMESRGFPDFRVADALVVHEEIEGPGEAYYIRQGVPTPQHRWMYGPTFTPGLLGLFGFNFPWKGVDMATEAAAEAGWSVRLVSKDGWVSRDHAVELLSECAATAFLYSCGNSGTSGAIRMGIAAHRPVLATGHCRQFRDLCTSWPGRWAISWCVDKDDVVAELRRLNDNLSYQRARTAAISLLADHDCWSRQAGKYAILYQKAIEKAKARQ